MLRWAGAIDRYDTEAMPPFSFTACCINTPKGVPSIFASIIPPLIVATPRNDGEEESRFTWPLFCGNKFWHT